MLKTITHTIMAASLLAATSIVAAPQAEARGGRVAGAVAGTIIGLGVLGAYAHSRERSCSRACYPGRERCEVAGQRCWYNRYGEYRCKDNVRCWRPTICD